jgi:hypothetical protein
VCDTDSPHLSNKALGVVVLVGADRLLVGTGQLSRHRPGRLPLAVAIRERHPAIDDQVMAVVHEHMAVAPRGALTESVAGKCRMDDGLAGQQGAGIGAGAMGFVAEPDAAEVPFGSLPACLGLPESLTRPRGWWRWIVLAIDPLAASLRVVEKQRPECPDSRVNRVE